ncbi:hypothetical protein I5Q34_13480 [Streptomyces sp. AV19]|uniref:hypothetical protein n=1 Tax=Streptomyces sp. AV19 TaxID=2793068 RepID=UPI0018FE1740|nr:hypothetical protein [Streptomyces sp. AV19]MBH1935271.1 hypothetical protein [Streptomyces sp. AV19]MDG4531158.1 hypothetical protein [Streptomyces sp. AV19]
MKTSNSRLVRAMATTTGLLLVATAGTAAASAPAERQPDAVAVTAPIGPTPGPWRPNHWFRQKHICEQVGREGVAGGKWRAYRCRPEHYRMWHLYFHP